jgi:hypothetical protein
MILASIITKVLVLTEAFLDFFVTVNTTGGGEFMDSALWSNCPATVVAQSGSMTDCGTTVINVVTNLIPTLLALLQGVLPGVVAQVG